MSRVPEVWSGADQRLPLLGPSSVMYVVVELIDPRLNGMMISPASSMNMSPASLSSPHASWRIAGENDFVPVAGQVATGGVPAEVQAPVASPVFAMSNWNHMLKIFIGCPPKITRMRRARRLSV